MKVLYVDACINRESSRTEHLARSLLKEIGGEVDTLVLEDLRLAPHDAESLRRRAESASKGDFTSDDFALGRKFKEADVVVIASPFWEMSYNGMTKLFLEHVSQVGLTFRYNERGIPEGMTNIRRLFYVTTRGGLCPDDGDLGFMNIRALSNMFGIPDVRILSANGLDIVGNDVEAIMSAAESRVHEITR